MKPSEQIQIQNAATSLQVKLWKERSRIWRIPPGIDDLIPIPVEIIVTELLRVRLEEPEEIPSDNPAAGVKIEIAGFMDRSGGRIVVAQKFPREWCRFTIAHEIAHWVLHPGVGYHRDRPLSGGERANPHRPPEEQSADLFAAELLMPTRVLRRYFHDRFGAR